MKWTTETFEGKRKRLYKWRRWFAWHWVELDGDLREAHQPKVWMWFAFVYRCQRTHWEPRLCRWSTHTYYREIPEVPHRIAEG